MRPYLPENCNAPGLLVIDALASAAKARMAPCLRMKELSSSPRSAQDKDSSSGPYLSTAFGSGTRAATAHTQRVPSLKMKPIQLR